VTLRSAEAENRFEHRVIGTANALLIVKQACGRDESFLAAVGIPTVAKQVTDDQRVKGMDLLHRAYILSGIPDSNPHDGARYLSVTNRCN
jgi:hypothetical protein